ncbi:MAG: cell division control protein 6, partial [Candidatus Altiarchaeota archaeon]|nr:cell division control protein 6 [Candidatus Altiarchaeota archaeon]
KGDLRVGIDLLRRSALLAERDASRKIEQGHVDKAFGSLSESRREELSENLPDEERILLDIIAECPGRMSGYFFMRFREKTGAGVKKYNEIVKRLERQGLIKAEYKKGVRGRSREIRLS